MSAAAKAAAREQKMRANGIPVEEWGNDATLMQLYADEMREIRRSYNMQRDTKYVPLALMTEVEP